MTIINEPVFVPQSTDPSEWNGNFTIVRMEFLEGYNKISKCQIVVKLPSPLTPLSKSSDTTSTENTTEAFITSKLLQHITISVTRSRGNLPLQSYPTKTFFHGILTNATIEIDADSDIAILEVRPYLWLLGQQVHHRVFSKLDAQEIVTKIFAEYQKDIQNDKFQVKFICDPSEERIQTAQCGETDLEFVYRLFKEEGWSFFFYYNEETVVLVITNKISFALSSVAEECNISEGLTLSVNTDTPLSAQSEEGGRMPLRNYRVNLSPTIRQVVANAFPDYRDAENNLTAKMPVEVEPSKGSNNIILTEPLWTRTTHLQNAETPQKEDYLNRVASDALARLTSPQLMFSGSLNVSTFLPCYQQYEVNFAQDSRRDVAGQSISYLMKKRTFYPFNTFHSFDRARGKFFQVDIEFFASNTEGSDTGSSGTEFKPLLELPREDLPPYYRTRNPHRLYSAIVVPFESDDETDNNYDVPNMVRVRLPWQKAGESIRVRLSTFWAGSERGSLFMPNEGDEVWVCFPTDDPDYGLIMGSSYNSKSDYPLDVRTRDTEGDFLTRGVIFDNKAASFTVAHANQKDDKEKPVVTIRTNEDGDIGVINVIGSEISLKSKTKLKAETTDPESSIKMDDKNVAINGFNGNGTITIEEGKMSVQSPEIALTGTEKISASALEVSLSGTAELSASAPDLSLKATGELSAKGGQVSITGVPSITANALTLLPGG